MLAISTTTTMSLSKKLLRMNVTRALLIGSTILLISNFIRKVDYTNKNFAIDLDLGRWDDRRQYKLFDNVAVGRKYIQLSKEFDVTLATQSSLDHLHWLPKIVETWRGPVSVAVFVPDIEFEAALLYIAKLRNCVIEVQHQVTFHFLFPVDKAPVPWVEAIALDDECLDPKNMLDQILTTERQVYPLKCYLHLSI